jgi:hypothetical protein
VLASRPRVIPTYRACLDRESVMRRWAVSTVRPLGDVDVAGVGELGVAGQLGPGDPERPGPGPVQALPPHLSVEAPERGDCERVAVSELAAVGVDHGVQPGADQVADAGVVAV